MTLPPGSPGRSALRRLCTPPERLDCIEERPDRFGRILAGPQLYALRLVARNLDGCYPAVDRVRVRPLGHGHTDDLVREPLKVVSLAWRQPPVYADLAVVFDNELITADERLLDALGHVLASSVYNLGLQQALRRALAGAVTAREEERRDLRREIHDGIGPTLAAALLRTETAMDLPPGCPSQAESLQKLHDLQKTALIDVRSLVEGLRPPALDHGGLLSALQHTPNLVLAWPCQTPRR